MPVFRRGKSPAFSPRSGRIHARRVSARGTDRSSRERLLTESEVFPLKNRIITKSAAGVLVLLMLLSLSPAVLGAAERDKAALVEETAAFELNNLDFGQGCEWAVIALARSGVSVPEGLFDRYYDSVVSYVQEKKGDFRKFTEYAKLSIALTAIGRDPGNVGGYDLLTPLLNYDNMVSVGINGVSWALLGLDCGNYLADDPAAAAMRQKYVDLLLSRQLADGGFSLVGKGGGSTPADTDITAMTLQALAGYTEQPAVAEAVGRAVSRLSDMQQEDGSYQTMGISTCESAAQVIIALGELGISIEDARFSKNGHSVLDAMLVYRQADGSYLHLLDKTGVGSIATEQAFCALVSALRASGGQSSLYRMTDVTKVAESASSQGLPEKHPDVRLRAVTKPGITFTDVAGAPCREAVEALSAREIINGKAENVYDPDAGMTRAEYAAIIVRALGLTPDAAGAAEFTDVPESSWFAAYVGTACSYGIVNGRGNGIFDPKGSITRQEAAVMTARAARLCGMHTDMDDGGVRMFLSEFGDYRKAASWASGSLAFCFKAGILVADEFELDLEPQKDILRSEVALMVWRLLRSAQLL